MEGQVSNVQDPQRLQKKRSRQRPLIKTNSSSSAISSPLLAQSASLQTIGRDGCRFSSKRLGGGCCGGRGNRWRGRERDREGRRMSFEPTRLNLGVRHNGKPSGGQSDAWILKLGPLELIARKARRTSDLTSARTHARTHARAHARTPARTPAHMHVHATRTRTRTRTDCTCGWHVRVLSKSLKNELRSS